MRRTIPPPFERTGATEEFFRHGAGRGRQLTGCNYSTAAIEAAALTSAAIALSGVSASSSPFLEASVFAPAPIAAPPAEQLTSSDCAIKSKILVKEARGGWNFGNRGVVMRKPFVTHLDNVETTAAACCKSTRVKSRSNATCDLLATKHSYAVGYDQGATYAEFRQS